MEQIHLQRTPYEFYANSTPLTKLKRPNGHSEKFLLNNPFAYSDSSSSDIQSPILPDTLSMDDGYATLSSLSSLMSTHDKVTPLIQTSTVHPNSIYTHSPNTFPITSLPRQQTPIPTIPLAYPQWYTHVSPGFGPFWNSLSPLREHLQHNQQSVMMSQPTVHAVTGHSVLPQFAHLPFPLFDHTNQSRLQTQYSISDPTLESGQIHSHNRVHNASSAFTRYSPHRRDATRVESGSKPTLPISDETQVNYQCLLSRVRQEMIGIIDNNLRQIQHYLCENTEKAVPESKHIDRVEYAPLNLKSDPNVKVSPTTSAGKIDNSEKFMLGSILRTDMQANQSGSNRSIKTGVTPNKSTRHGSCENQTPIGKADTRLKPVGLRRRRLRIRAGGRRLRIRQLVGKPDRQIKTSDRAIDTNITSVDGTLDLRLRPGELDQLMLDESQSPFLLHTPDSRDLCESLVKTTVLTASHLKRAKMMFMFARYPNSTLIKSFFPDVTFSRSTTAQLVKWFSNFREFFYIQIEKHTRMCYAESRLSELTIRREHELFTTLEQHYNKDREIVTPEEFLLTTQLAVREFFNAISTQKDKSPTWKKSIYKTVALLDTDFPHFLKFVK
ncbi:unnamed protein product [Calicophoron daubneyi]|uniref:Prospero domain-containing protein n=1 Tax=Calicophoron daubneyi TaxID=300641 RepID=A0AAV2T352_CALDB